MVNIMVLGVINKRIIFVVALIVSLVTFLVATSSSDKFNTNAVDPKDPTKTITITKNWAGDIPADRPNSITAYIKKTSSELITGPALNLKMKGLAGTSTSGTDAANSTITAFRKATDAEYEAVKNTLTSNNEIQASGEKTYMWYSGGTIYIYSEADNLYLPAESKQLFRKMNALSDISGAAYLNTAYSTTFEQMFQDSYNITDAQLAHLANWDTGNVTTMRFMFGGNLGTGSNCANNHKLTDLSPLTNWNTQKLQNTDQMFKCNTSLEDLSPISDWNMSNLVYMQNMFNLTGVTDMTPILDWDVVRVTNFTGVFSKAPIAVYDQFTNRPGSWDTSNWTYTPTSGPTSGSAPTATKVKSPDQET